MMGKLFNSGLDSVKVATGVHRAVAATIATTTSPKAYATIPVSPSLPESGTVAVPDVIGVDFKPERLPSVEEELKVLAATIEALKQPGFNRAEVTRLHKTIGGVKV